MRLSGSVSAPSLLAGRFDTLVLCVLCQVLTIPAQQVHTYVRKRTYTPLTSTCAVCVLQGANVKKPYNPVLGEVFRCYYELPEVMQVDREMDQTRMVSDYCDRHDTHECVP